MPPTENHRQPFFDQETKLAGIAMLAVLGCMVLVIGGFSLAGRHKRDVKLQCMKQCQELMYRDDKAAPIECSVGCGIRSETVNELAPETQSGATVEQQVSDGVQRALSRMGALQRAANLGPDLTITSGKDVYIIHIPILLLVMSVFVGFACRGLIVSVNR